MEGISRTLIQEKAVLVARQGDPKSPAAGTLLARQRILHAELEAATARQEAASRPLPVNGGAVPPPGSDPPRYPPHRERALQSPGPVAGNRCANLRRRLQGGDLKHGVNPLPDTADTLDSALRRHGFDFPAEQIESLDRYCRLLWEWNEKLNLTRHTDYEKFVARDVVDSLQLSVLIESGERVLDVGTGGGVPGVILAIMRHRSRRRPLRVDGQKGQSRGRHRQAARTRSDGLPRTGGSNFGRRTLRHARDPRRRPLDKLMTWFTPVRGSFDQMLVIKGPAWTAERAKARERQLHKVFNLRKEAAYKIPGTEVESVVLRIWPQDAE